MILHHLAILLALLSLSTALLGQFRSPRWSGLCLDIEDAKEKHSPVVLNECDSSVATQYWRIDDKHHTIISKMGKKCLEIHHDGHESDDDFVSQRIEATACVYLNSRRSGVKGQADGYQKLMFANETIIWRGQSKRLPSALTERYCIEAVPSEEYGISLVLEHCKKGKPQQHFQFGADKDIRPNILPHSN